MLKRLLFIVMVVSLFSNPSYAGYHFEMIAASIALENRLHPVIKFEYVEPKDFTKNSLSKIIVEGDKIENKKVIDEVESEKIKELLLIHKSDIEITKFIIESKEALDFRERTNIFDAISVVFLEKPIIDKLSSAEDHIKEIILLMADGGEIHTEQSIVRIDENNFILNNIIYYLVKVGNENRKYILGGRRWKVQCTNNCWLGTPRLILEKKFVTDPPRIAWYTDGYDKSVNNYNICMTNFLDITDPVSDYVLHNVGNKTELELDDGSFSLCFSKIEESYKNFLFVEALNSSGKIIMRSNVIELPYSISKCQKPSVGQRPPPPNAPPNFDLVSYLYDPTLKLK